MSAFFLAQCAGLAKAFDGRGLGGDGHVRFKSAGRFVYLVVYLVVYLARYTNPRLA